MPKKAPPKKASDLSREEMLLREGLESTRQQIAGILEKILDDYADVTAGRKTENESEKSLMGIKKKLPKTCEYLILLYNDCLKTKNEEGKASIYHPRRIEAAKTLLTGILIDVPKRCGVKPDKNGYLPEPARTPAPAAATAPAPAARAPAPAPVARVPARAPAPAPVARAPAPAPFDLSHLPQDFRSMAERATELAKRREYIDAIELYMQIINYLELQNDEKSKEELIKYKRLVEHLLHIAEEQKRGASAAEMEPEPEPEPVSNPKGAALAAAASADAASAVAASATAAANRVSALSQPDAMMIDTLIKDATAIEEIAESERESNPRTAEARYIDAKNKYEEARDLMNRDTATYSEEIRKVNSIITDIGEKIASVKEPASLSEMVGSMFGMGSSTMGPSLEKPLPMPGGLGGGKLKRKYKRTRKTYKHKRSKHKKTHKRKKSLKRKYKKISKRR